MVVAVLEASRAEHGRPDLRVLALLAATIAAVFAEITIGDRLMHSDGQWSAYFDRPAMWSESWIGGWPIGADTAAFNLYPVRIVFSMLGVPFSWFVVFAYVLAGGGLYTYLRFAGCSNVPAFLGGLSCVLGGFMIAHASHTSMVHAASWIIVALASLEAVLRRGSRTGMLVGAVAIGMSALSGHVQLTLYGGGLLAAYVLWHVPMLAAPGSRLRVVRALSTLVAGVLLCAPQLLLTASYVPETVRAQLTLADFRDFSLPLDQLLIGLFPFLYGGEFSLPYGVPYFGAYNTAEISFAMPLMAWFLAAVALGDRARLPAFWALVAAVALVLAASGEFEWLARALYHVPGLNLFRAPARHLFEVSLALSVLFAFGCERLLARASALRWTPLLSSGLLFLAGVSLTAWLAWGGLVARAARQGVQLTDLLHYRAVLVPLAFGLLGLVALYAGRLTGMLRLTLAVAMTLTLALQARSHPWRSVAPADSYLALTPDETAALREMGDSRSVHLRGAYGTVLSADRTRIAGAPSVNWYGPLRPRLAAEALTVSSVGIPDPRLLAPQDHALDVYAVKWLVAEPEAGTMAEPIRVALADTGRWRRVREVGPATIYENLRALPMARLVGETRCVAPGESVAFLRGIAGPYDPAQEVVGSCPTSEQIAGFDAAEASARFEWEAPGFASVHLESASDAFLVVAVNGLSAWHAAIDGRAAPWFQADHSLMAMRVPAGVHRVTLHYRPTRALAWGLAATLAAIALLLLAGSMKLPSETRA